MKGFVITIFALAFAVDTAAQSAKVIQLGDKDAAEIKALYAEQEATQKKIDAFKEHVWEVYTTAPKTGDYCPQTSSVASIVNFRDQNVRCVKDGWSYGFSYSDDFKYIVPNPMPEFKTAWPFGLNGGCGFAAPAAASTNTGIDIQAK